MMDPEKSAVEGENPHLTKWPPVVAIVGPTAVGKSAAAQSLARRLGGSIVTADSRQVYRYMDIGTAKPSAREQADVPHYMLDLVTPDEVYSAQRFQVEGRAVLRRLAAQGRAALVVGGTGFYVRAMLDGLRLPRVAPNLALRARLRAEAEHAGMESLHRRLAERDPASAARIHPNNLPRLIRALEVVESTGQPVAAARGEAIPALYLGLRMERSALRRRADRRIRSQVSAGLVEETRQLLEMGYDPDGPALSGFGYRQMMEYLRGSCTLEEAIRGYTHATHRFIRRQMTWFTADERIEWLDQGPELEEAVARMANVWLDARGR